MKKPLIISLAILVASLGVLGYAIYYRIQANNDSSPDGTWKNPKFTCDNVDEKYIYGDLTPEDYADFCDEINNRFKKSNLTNTEADEIYRMLAFKTILVSNTNTRKLFLWSREDISGTAAENLARVKISTAVKKINDTEYEIFYIDSSICGIDRLLKKITIENGKIIDVQQLKNMSESHPC